MGIFRKPLLYGGTACLAFLLSAALIKEKVQARISEALQTATPQTQFKPLLNDEYHKQWSRVLKNAKVETGPRLKNPATSKDGLEPGVVKVLLEQRNYLEAHGTSSPAQAPVNAATREPIGDDSRRLRRDPRCREPLIRSVNGKTKGVVFTPMAADNTYKIEGCFFGAAPGIVQLEVRPGPRQPNAIPPILMQLDPTSPGSWSEHEITAHLDTDLKGIPDHAVTLVLYPAKHRRIELRGCRFVAARGHPQLLSMIPSAWVSLYPSGVGSRSIRQLEYFSPTEAGSAVPKDASASSAFVVRSDPEQFGIGTDNYDFSQLNPGWVVESVQLQTYSVSCPEVGTSAQSFGRWEAEWALRGVTVTFKDSVCAASVPPSFAFNMSLSQYAIRVWVVGPVGTQPLRAQNERWQISNH
jgi:hypothetical protein